MSKTFNKNLVAQAYQDRFGGTKVNSEAVVYFFQELIQQELYRGVPIFLPMVGKFTPFLRKARVARNPKTGEKVNCKAVHTVKFRPSKKMKDWLNKNRKA